MTPTQIAADLSADARMILLKACEPVPQDTFPGLENADRKAMVAAGLIRELGYFVEATELGRSVADAVFALERAREGGG